RRPRNPTAQLSARLLWLYIGVKNPDPEFARVRPAWLEGLADVDDQVDHVGRSELRRRQRERLQRRSLRIAGEVSHRLIPDLQRDLLRGVEQVGTRVVLQVQRRVLLGV